MVSTDGTSINRIQNDYTLEHRKVVVTTSLGYYIGIVDTLILIILWAITRMPGNPITGRGGPLSEIGVAIQVFQIVVNYSGKYMT